MQASIALFAILWSGGWTAVIGLALKAVMGWRIDEEDEVEGIDVNEHAETAYDFVGTGGGSRSLVGAGSGSSAQRKESVDA